MLRNRVFSHYGYAVADLASAVEHWHSVLGAGPFFVVEDMRFDAITHHGRPCTLRHSAAFGQWQSVAIELMQIEECTPPSLAQHMIPGPMPVLNHVAYLSDDPEADSQSLHSMGAPLFLNARFGEVEVVVHDARDKIGCNVEIHRKSEFIESFFSMVREASVGWDGADPLRVFQVDG